ncbi:MFS transporter [Bacillus thermotolerans]|uniref:MFS transporter n=1 Tax=Bacillus thermotolerans TaxID=1221996 RepID=UPI00057D3001|nr:MFS transporter [Bacillus thermotolerans]KKB37852.1 D-galactonate transporter [Bacillus thermotolerans]
MEKLPLETAEVRDPNPKSPRKRKVKARWWVMFFIFLSTVLAYTDRSNISIVAVTMMEEFGWNEQQFGLLASAFFVGYLLLGIPAGWMSDKWGGVRFLAIGVIIWSVFTIATPLAWSFASMLMIRFLLGVGEAVNFPSHTAVVSKWSPLHTRGRWQGLNMSGMAVGVMITAPITTWLTTQFNWHASFYFFGVLGIIWAIIWFKIATDEPKDHPFITEEELAEMEDGTSHKEEKEEVKIPWSKIFRVKEVWGVTLIYFFQNYNWYLYLTWLPAYFMTERGFTILNVGIYGALPWLGAFIAMNVAGLFSDYLSKRYTLTQSRRIPIYISFLGTAIFMALGAYTPNEWAALAYITLSVTCLGINFTMFWTLPIDIGPKSAGTLSGIMNTSGTVAGIIAPALTGFLIVLFGSWQYVLFLGAALALMGALLTRFMISAKQVLD